MSLELFGHPFSSYTWKVLIPLWANEIPFTFRPIGPDQPENGAALQQHWAFGQFPLLLDEGRPVAESTCIIDHLDAHHPGPHRWIPDGDLGRRVRFLDRVFDLRVMNMLTVPVADALRPPGERDPYGVQQARERLLIAYNWLEQNLPDHGWATGEAFTLVECAAAPALFYADWVEPFGETRPRLSGYRARLLAHPVVARCVDEARPYRTFFPLGAAGRD